MALLGDDLLGSAAGLYCQGDSNGSGVQFVGQGSGAGANLVAGGTGDALELVAGATSGDCISATAAGSGTALSTLLLSDINGEIVDVIRVDTLTLPGQGAPSATPTLDQALAHIYKRFRNKETQTDTDYKLYADDGTTVDAKATVSDDDTTFTKGELVTGP